jgi:hypothetical protein
MKTILLLCLFLLASCTATPTAPVGEVCPISGEPIDPTVPAVLMATVDGTVVKAPRFCPKHSKLTAEQQAAALAAKGK